MISGGDNTKLEFPPEIISLAERVTMDGDPPRLCQVEYIELADISSYAGVKESCAILIDAETKMKGLQKQHQVAKRRFVETLQQLEEQTKTTPADGTICEYNGSETGGESYSIKLQTDTSCKAAAQASTALEEEGRTTAGQMNELRAEFKKGVQENFERLGTFDIQGYEKYLEQRQGFMKQWKVSAEEFEEGVDFLAKDEGKLFSKRREFANKIQEGFQDAFDLFSGATQKMDGEARRQLVVTAREEVLKELGEKKVPMLWLKFQIFSKAIKLAQATGAPTSTP